MLDSELTLGISILALIHAGDISVTCQDCSDLQKTHYHCTDEDSDTVVFENEDVGQLCNCPILWISSSVVDFYDEYSYYTMYPQAAPRYEDRSLRFWEATKLYKRLYDKYLYKKTDNQDKAKKTDDTLKKFRAIKGVKR